MTRAGQQWPDLQPCGTPAAALRHSRRGEPVCYPCLQAMARAWQDRTGQEYRGPQVPDPRPVRNGLPGPRPYVYRGTGADAYTGEVVL